MRFRPLLVASGFVLMTGVLSACGDGAQSATGSRIEVTLQGLAAVDPSAVGAFEVWVHGPDGDARSLGRLSELPGERGAASTFEFDLPLAGPTGVSVTLEPPGDDDDQPSSFVLMAGDLAGGAGDLSVVGQLTEDEPLQPEPGAHSLFTTSNNVRLGYPSFEESGLWMFSLRSRENVHGTREVRLTRLQPSWVYEGWIVRGFGGPDEIWISYGKFRPDFAGLLSSRDDTGSGPFSGDEDYLNAGVEDVPGDEWTTAEVAHQLGFRLPGDVELPIMVDAVDPATGEAVWTHVITIEPAFDEGEPMYSGTPFLVRPYRNQVGAGGPAHPRVILYQESEVPSGRARIVD